MKRSKKRSKVWSRIDLLILLIQLVCSVGFVYLVKDLLPNMYLAIVIAVLVVLFTGVGTIYAGLARKIRRKNKGKVANVIMWLFSLVFSAGLVYGGSVVYQGLDTLEDVANVTYQSHVMNVAVSKESSYQTIQDMQDKTIGIIEGMDDENIKKALDMIAEKEKVSLIKQSYASMLDAYNALVDGNIDGILINEAYSMVVSEVIPNYSDNVRTLYQVEVVEEIVLDDEPEVTPTQEPDGEEPSVTPEAPVQNNVPRNPVVTKDTFNIFISGIDTYGSVSAVSRSDVNMIVTVNPTTKQILMTSIPRDYYVELASKGAYDKLTHAGIYGVKESINTLENLFGIQIDYYVKVNFTSLIKIVDAVGGITVSNPVAFETYAAKEYFPKGDISMDGEKALRYVRERYAFSDGDNMRVKNQQRVLTALIKKMISPAIIKNYNDVLDAVSGSFVTNMSSEEIQSLLQMQLSDMSTWDFEQISVIGYDRSSSSCYSMPGYAVYVMKPDYDSVNAATEKINAMYEN